MIQTTKNALDNVKLVNLYKDKGVLRIAVQVTFIDKYQVKMVEIIQNVRNARGNITSNLLKMFARIHAQIIIFLIKLQMNARNVTVPV